MERPKPDLDSYNAAFVEKDRFVLPGLFAQRDVSWAQRPRTKRNRAQAVDLGGQLEETGLPTRQSVGVMNRDWAVVARIVRLDDVFQNPVVQFGHRLTTIGLQHVKQINRLKLEVFLGHLAFGYL